jgi:2-oxo-3-hexenedioate decarboxylase/2-keto-4-pentenoate hydratase
MSDTTTPVKTTSVEPRVAQATARLADAAREGLPCAPVRDLIGRDDVAAAYAVQQQIVASRIAGGATVIGRKIGLTSAAVQKQLGVDQPDFGVLFKDMSYAHGDTIPFDAVLQPRVEAEVAFLLKADLESGDLSIDQVRAAVDYAVAALEICGSRVRDWDISFGDTVADNASSGAFVLGNHPRTLDEFEPSAVSMTMTVTGQDLSTGNGSACLGDPLLALQWLARQARDLGAPLRAGQIILSGALGPMRTVTPGAEAIATITGLGEVSVQFGNVTSDKDE